MAIFRSVMWTLVTVIVLLLWAINTGHLEVNP